MTKLTKFLPGLALGLALALPAAAEDVTADTVIATVNGTEITLGSMIVARDSLPQQYLSLADDVLFKGILDQLVQQTALKQSVEGSLTKRDKLELQNQELGYISGIALQTASAAAVTDEAIQAAYDAKYKDFEPGTEYHAAHILVATEEEAKALKAEIDGGADFAELARTKSTDPGSGANGGELGWFGKGMMVTPFEDAVAGMKAGDVSGPIQTQFGWHLIKLSETRPSTAPTLETVRDELAAELEQSALQDHIQQVTEAATVTKPGEGIDPALLKDQTLLDK